MDDSVEFPITNEIDLHTFNPKEVSELLEEYFKECIARDIFQVRVIHGKGQGILKKRVHSVLKKNPSVLDFKDAPVTRGGWGATIVNLDSSYQI